jgi:hypothetical protein
MQRCHEYMLSSAAQGPFFVTEERYRIFQNTGEGDGTRELLDFQSGGYSYLRISNRRKPRENVNF